jgi:hypothetical protein
VNRPPLEKLRRIAECGIHLDIPQAKDMAETIDYALGLEKALLFVRGWFHGLEGNTTPDDPLAQIRKRVHAPVHKAIDEVLGTANEAAGSRNDPPEANKK